MKDTPPAIERKFRQMLLKRSGEERLKMGCSMHATARKLAKTALLQKCPGASLAELKRMIFLHFYGADFAPDERTRIAAALSKSAKRAGATWAGADSAPVNTQVDERPHRTGPNAGPARRNERKRGRISKEQRCSRARKAKA